MSGRGQFFFTPHAVRRYIQRYARHYDYDEALNQLVAIGRGARLMKHGGRGGAEIWRGPRPGRIRLVVNRGGMGLPAVVTVL